jgi:hypothetical protein
METGVMNQSISLGPSHMITAWTGESLPVVGVFDFDFGDCFIALRHRGSWFAPIWNGNFIPRMNCRHVMKKCRFLNKSLVAIYTSVSKLLTMSHNMIIHSVLTLKDFITVLVRADKMSIVVLRVFNGH